MTEKLSHIDKQNRPQMVDVSDKPTTIRVALAESVVVFPEDAWSYLMESGFTSKKGPLLDVARIAGTMAVKKTADLIPFCHPLPIDGCTLDLELEEASRSVRIRCQVSTCARTGVEMEALTGASVAALALYDMSKSLGHGITIENTQLLKKSGGKSDFSAHE